MSKPARVHRTPARERGRPGTPRRAAGKKLDATAIVRRFITLMVIVIVLGSALYVTRSIVQLFAIPETIAFNETTARAAARSFVLESLVEPSSASFASPDELLVEELGDGIFTCNGWLDAKTNHGDGLRAGFTCRMRGTETGEWELVEPVSLTEPTDARGSIVRGGG